MDLSAHKSHGPSTFNVLVQYSAAARNGRTDSDWNAFLDQLFADTNAAFQNSGIDIAFVRVADRLATIADDATNTAALEQLSADTNVAQARVDNDAHFVTLLRPWHAGHGQCGAARLPVCGDDARCYDEDIGFSAVSVGGACSVHTLAHQLGHNLGSAHEPADGQQGTYPYSHAHVAGAVATVMSTAAAPSAVFSSPGATCGGQPCGVADVSDNVRSLQQTRHFIERWLTEPNITMVEPIAPVALGDLMAVNFTWFGVVGTNFNVHLYRDGVRGETLAQNRSIPDGVANITLPATVGPGTYTVRIVSVAKPEVLVETALTVVEPPPAARIEFTAQRVTATGGSATVSVARSGVTTNEVTVEYVTVGGSAQAGINFTPVSGSFTWAAGDTSTRSITVPILGAAEGGSPTSVFVALRNPSAGAEIGSAVEIVIPGRPGGGDGGGGTFGGGALALLLGLAWVRRRQTK